MTKLIILIANITELLGDEIFMHLSMFSPRVGGGGTTHGKLTQPASPGSGFWQLNAAPGSGIWLLRQVANRTKSPRGGNLTFPRCPGVGNLTLASMKMSKSAGSACRSRGKKGKFRGIFRGESRRKWPILREFRGNFQDQFCWKTNCKERPISWELPKQISLESDWFCADLRKVFN